MHRAMVLLRVSTVVAFCAALIGGGAVGAKAGIIASVPAGVHWRASPEGMSLWGPKRLWPGSGLVLRSLGPGFTVLALGPGFRPILILNHTGSQKQTNATITLFADLVRYPCCYPHTANTFYGWFMAAHVLPLWLVYGWACATCWTALWHLDALCYEGCEGHGTANGLPQPRIELAERRHEHTYLGRNCRWSQAVLNS